MNDQNMDDFESADLDLETEDSQFEEMEAEDEMAASQPRKKSGGLFMVIVLLLVLGGGGAFYYFKFMRGGAQAPVQTATNAQMPAQPVAPMNGGDPMTANAMPGSVPAADIPGAAPADMPPQAQPTADGAMPPAMADANAMPAAPAMPPVVSMGGTDDTPAVPAATSDTAQGQALSSADPLSWGGQPPAAASDATTATAPVDASTVSQTDVKTETPAIDTAAAPADLPSGVTMVTDDKASAVPSQDKLASEQVQKLQDRMDALENSLSMLQSSLATKDDVAALKELVVKLQAKTASAPQKSKAEDDAPAKPSRKAAATKVDSETFVATVPAVPAKPVRPVLSVSSVANSAWVLKSAKPGTAWIASKGTQELKTVSVGDTVKGLGKITSIAKDSMGKWVVNGTQGHVNQ